MTSTAEAAALSPPEHSGLLYVIWSNEHKMWWRANRCGYTPRLASAGRYTRQEAIDTSRPGWHHVYRNGLRVPDEIPVLLEDAMECHGPTISLNIPGATAT